MSTQTLINPPSIWKRLWRRSHGDSPLKRALIHAILIFACIVAIYPAIRVFSVSLRPGDRLLSTSLDLIPQDATWANYQRLLFQTDFFLWVWNSLLITIVTSLAGVLLAATAGYAFSRWKFPGRAPGLILLLTTQMMPAVMMLIPTYLMFVEITRTFGVPLVGSYLGLIVAYMMGSVAFSIWILKGYYDTIPIDLEEAAKIDGTSELGAFYRVILPLSTPALAIVFLFNFTYAWVEYPLARVILPKAESFTWTLGLRSLQSQFNTEWGTFAAASVLVAIPSLALFLWSSKWLISGLTIGSVKG